VYESGAGLTAFYCIYSILGFSGGQASLGMGKPASFKISCMMVEPGSRGISTLGKSQMLYEYRRIPGLIYLFSA
jgi:hypothetical protein